MKIKTAELTGKALDWALAKALGSKHITHDALGVYADDRDFPIKRNVFGRVNHTDPTTCMCCFGFEAGQVSELFADSDLCCYVARGYSAIYTGEMVHGIGSTIAEAVARCVVAMQSGDEVEVPDKLCGGES